MDFSLSLNLPFFQGIENVLQKRAFLMKTDAWERKAKVFLDLAAKHSKIIMKCMPKKFSNCLIVRFFQSSQELFTL